MQQYPTDGQRRRYNPDQQPQPQQYRVQGYRPQYQQPTQQQPTYQQYPQYQQPQQPTYQAPVYQTQQPPTKAKQKKGCLVRILTCVAIGLGLMIVIGTLGGSSKPSSNTPSQIATGAPVVNAASVPQPTSAPVSNETIGQRNALRHAKSYLEFQAFSRKGLLDQLAYEGYSSEDAIYGVDHCGADWNEQAVKKAKSYLELMSFSRQGLIDQLLFDGFTADQAEHGVIGAGY